MMQQLIPWRFQLQLSLIFCTSQFRRDRVVLSLLIRLSPLPQLQVCAQDLRPGGWLRFRSCEFLVLYLDWDWFYDFLQQQELRRLSRSASFWLCIVP